MLNLDSTLFSGSIYNKLKEWENKILNYFGMAFPFMDFLRCQIPETKLLQLIPGLFFILTCNTLGSCVLFSQFIARFIKDLEAIKEDGTKTGERIVARITYKLAYFLLIFGIGFVVSTIFPVGLDSFSYYQEPSLEDLWSFDEVVSLEYALFATYIIFSQFPTADTLKSSDELQFLFYPLTWKSVIFFLVIGAGVLTPTLDSYTQFNFAGSAVALYAMIVNYCGKQTLYRFTGIINHNG